MVEPSQGMELEMKPEPMSGRASMTSAPHSEEGTGQQSAGRPKDSTASNYRWMISYFCCHGFMDKNIMGLRGSNLRMSHILIYDIFRYVAENLVFLSKADRKNGNSTELNKMLVTFDEMTMGQIMAGFPDLLGIPHQLLPVFLVSEIDQLTCVPYIDAVESFGLPADCCPVPSSESMIFLSMKPWQQK